MSVRRHRFAFTLIELLVSIAIMAVLTGLLLAAVQRVRASAARAQCLNTLRQLGLAAHQYHDANRAFPSGCSYRDGADPQPHMSWLTRLLPHLEQEVLWRQALNAFAQQRFFEAPAHHSLLGRVMPAFLCPSDDLAVTPAVVSSFSVAFTDFLGVEGLNQHRKDGVLFLDSRIGLSEVTDGTSQTLLAGERPPSGERNLGWWYAGWGQAKDGSAEMLLGAREILASPSLVGCDPNGTGLLPGRGDRQCDYLHFWSYHPGGAHFLFCDGSARFLAYSADAILPALATRAAGEAVAIPD